MNIFKDMWETLLIVLALVLTIIFYVVIIIGATIIGLIPIALTVAVVIWVLRLMGVHV